MKSPIAKLDKGTVVNVAKIPRRYGTVIPCYVAGKIGYVATKDITFSESKGQNVMEHRIEETPPEDSSHLNNHLVLYFNRLELGPQWRAASELAGDEKIDYISNHQLYMEHHPPSSRYSFGLGLGYYSMVQETFYLKTYTGEAFLAWSPLQFSLVSFDFVAGVVFSGDFRMGSRYNTDRDRKEKGQMWGNIWGAQIRIFPFSQLNFTLGSSLKVMRISNIDPLIYDSRNPSLNYSVKRIGGNNFYFGVGYMF
jgi:hypothetical protein